MEITSKSAAQAVFSDEPIFKAVFGDDWQNLPPVMQRRYNVRPFSDDVVTVKGTLDIRISPLVSLLAKTTGMLLAYSGDNIPVTVTFRSGKTSNAFRFERVFHFPDRGDIGFQSRMEHAGGNEMIEFMGLGIGWKFACLWNGTSVVLQHRGYIWRIFGITVPIPAALIMGKGHAEETPESDNGFRMFTHAAHPIFGKTFAYTGAFTLAEEPCDKS